MGIFGLILGVLGGAQSALDYLEPVRAYKVFKGNIEAILRLS